MILGPQVIKTHRRISNIALWIQKLAPRQAEHLKAGVLLAQILHQIFQTIKMVLRVSQPSNDFLPQLLPKVSSPSAVSSPIVSVCGCNNSNPRSNNAKWNFKIQKNLLKNVSHLICPFYLVASLLGGLFRGFYDKLTLFRALKRSSRSQSETE